MTIWSNVDALLAQHNKQTNKQPEPTEGERAHMQHKVKTWDYTTNTSSSTNVWLGTYVSTTTLTVILRHLPKKKKLLGGERGGGGEIFLLAPSLKQINLVFVHNSMLIKLYLEIASSPVLSLSRPKALSTMASFLARRSAIPSASEGAKDCDFLSTSSNSSTLSNT